jgi:signal transduction histidine kinase
VQIEGPKLKFDSHPEIAQRHGYSRWANHEGGDFSLERSTADGHRIHFGLASPWPVERPRTFGWLTLAVLLLLTLSAFAAVRRLLRPLQAINAGVARFGAGDFAQPITTPRRDELGDLAERINTMARSLQGMLDAKRALLLAISHELRSPLTRARVNAELVPEGEHRDALLRDLGAMRDLITDLLESERLASGHAALQTERLALPGLVRELVAAQFAGVPLTLILDDSLPALQADPMRLRLLLRNLIDNALRHGAGAAQPPQITLAREAGGGVCLTVRDFGPGVGDEQLAHLAEPFHRADAARARSTGGVGLGLYLCLLVMRAHGGQLGFGHAQPGLMVTARFPTR